MCKTAARFLGIFKQGLKKNLPKITLKKPRRWLSVDKRTPSSFWLWNAVSLSSKSDRVNGMESQKRGWCPRMFLVKLFTHNAVQRNGGECAEWVML
ncbi:hypothetical protein AB9K32_11920 [Allomuricauda sp. XS_ASV26]|uniref:hypothetical protein n=1 Tax=Allomuricauda sp. XS_ASV26 TaxID=3241292 RepID=UPI0035131ADF